MWFGAPKESWGWSVGGLVSADERMDGERTLRAKFERSLDICVGRGSGRYRARTRGRAGSMSVVCAVCEAYCGGTVGGVWKKPVVAEDGLREDMAVL